jgi:hypothetical protein
VLKAKFRTFGQIFYGLMNTELLSDLPQALNGGFILFLLCFFVCSRLLGGHLRMISLMIHNLFFQKDRAIKFSDPVSNELFIKCLLIGQSCILGSVIVYFSCAYWWNLAYVSMTELFSSLGYLALLVLGYIVYKFLILLITGFTFFKKEELLLWTDNFVSILALSGLIFFIPALLIFYVPETTVYCYYFSIIYFIFVQMLLFYKIYVIFFHQKGFSLHFILYLCTLEIVPLFLGYKALIYLLII